MTNIGINILRILVESALITSSIALVVFLMTRVLRVRDLRNGPKEILIGWDQTEESIVESAVEQAGSRPVQQLFANVMSREIAVEHLHLPSSSLVLYNYPRNVSDKIPEIAVTQFEEFLRQRRGTIDFDNLKLEVECLKGNAKLIGLDPLKVFAIAREVHQQYGSYNSEPARYDSFASIAKAEGIEVNMIPGIRVLSGLGIESHGKGPRSYRIILKQDLHPSLQLFLLGHELGHWFIHVKPRIDIQAEQGGNFVYYHSYYDQYSIFEHQADVFTILGLFPTAELLWLESAQRLTPQTLTEQILDRSGGGVVSAELESFIRSYAQKRIAIYKSFRAERLEPKPYPRDTITREEIEFQKKYLWKDALWDEIDQDIHSPKIIDASLPLVQMLGFMSVSEILGFRLEDLIVEKDRDRVKEQIGMKPIQRKAFYYMTRYLAKDGKAIEFLVCAYPVVDESGNYCGSFAVLQPRTW